MSPCTIHLGTFIWGPIDNVALRSDLHLLCFDVATVGVLPLGTVPSYPRHVTLISTPSLFTFPICIFTFVRISISNPTRGLVRSVFRCRASSGSSSRADVDVAITPRNVVLFLLSLKKAGTVPFASVSPDFADLTVTARGW